MEGWQVSAFWKETIVHSRLRTVGVSLPIPRRPDHWHQWVSSKPLSEMTFCYPSYVGKKTKEKIDKLRSFSVCEKRAVPFFVLSKTSFFPTASHISDKQWTGQALNSCFWGTQEARRCPANSLKMSQNRFSVFRELQACIKPLPVSCLSCGQEISNSPQENPYRKGSGNSQNFRWKPKPLPYRPLALSIEAFPLLKRH